MRIKIYQVGMRKCLEIEGVRIPIKNYRVMDTLVRGKRLEIEIELRDHTLTFEGEPDSDSVIQEKKRKIRKGIITMGIKIDLQGNVLQVKNADAMQFTVIKSWNKMKWDRKLQALTGIADIELLDKLASLVQLPPEAEKRRRKLHIVRDAVDRERVNQSPKPFCKFPVKLPLYAHQVRAANMALLTFGWADAKERG